MRIELRAWLSRALSSILRDRVYVSLLLGAVAANAALFFYLLAIYERLPAFLPLHFDASGEVDRIAFKSESFKMPFIGLGILAANFLLSGPLQGKERLTARLLMAAALLVQLVFWWAAINIIY